MEYRTITHILDANVSNVTRRMRGRSSRAVWEGTKRWMSARPNEERPG